MAYIKGIKINLADPSNYDINITSPKIVSAYNLLYCKIKNFQKTATCNTSQCHPIRRILSDETRSEHSVEHFR